ncbi:MAG: hypothetical protein ACQGVK_12525 [Myxococcota bacterium]
MRTGWIGVGVALLVLAWSGPSEAARVLDLRVGRHAEFTRVVLELDTPAGYKIEHHEPVPGTSELVVSLEASGAAKKIVGAKRRIDSVSLEPAGPGRSVLRIRLSRQGLRLKEMILAGPPRIVLDVLGGEPETRTAKAPAPVPPKSAPAPEPGVEPEPAPPAPAEEAAPAVAETVAEATPPTDSAPSAAPEPEPAAEDAPLAHPEPVAAADPDTGEAVADETADTGDRADTGAFDEFGTAEEPESGELAMATPEERAAPSPTPTPAARPARTPAPPAPAAEDGSLFSLQNMALAAAAILLVGGGLFVARRRSLANSQTESAEGEEFGDDHPFAGFGEAEAAPAADAEAEPAETDAVTETVEMLDASPAPADAPAEPSLFDAVPDEGPEKEIEEVEMETATSGIDLAAAPAAGGDEVMRLVRELERRVTSLETRLDEAVDAKERLERQVAAQTEELRVQRAAIARTQRAVRNLSRPEEEGATEPAPREG